MNNDGKIYIYISDTPQEQGQQVEKKKEKKTKKEPELNDFLQHEFHNFVEAQAKQFVNYSIANIGNFTGNYLAQQNTQATISVINTLKSIGLSAMAGFKATGGNPIGAAVGAAVAIASTGINYAYGEISANFQVKKQNREIEMMRDRLGMNSLTNGSR